MTIKNITKIALALALLMGTAACGEGVSETHNEIQVEVVEMTTPERIDLGNVTVLSVTECYNREGKDSSCGAGDWWVEESGHAYYDGNNSDVTVTITYVN